jgi:hypothetical protein
MRNKNPTIHKLALARKYTAFTLLNMNLIPYFTKNSPRWAAKLANLSYSGILH